MPIFQPVVAVGSDEDRLGMLLDELETLTTTLDRALEMQNEARAAMCEAARLVTIVQCKITIARAALDDAQRRRRPIGAVAAARRRAAVRS